jgi:pyruvate formate lyase activating enzyme
VNERGKLYTLIYGLAGSVAVDPIEKKPLHHFHPGSSVLSFGAPGCNLGCEFCQNSTLSQVEPEDITLSEVDAKTIPNLAKGNMAQGVAWTYNEPSIWHEWSIEGMRECKRAGLYTVYVSNGYINEAPHRELKGLLDAMNVDVKAFTEDFYRKICKGRLQPVLDTCVRAVEMGMHLEVTYLVVPTLNDSPDMIRKFAKWVVDSLGPDVVVHFSRFHPDYKMMHLPSTPIESLKMAHDVARAEGVRYLFLGNIHQGGYEDTRCHSCGALVIERIGFSVKIVSLGKDSTCGKCGKRLPIIGKVRDTSGFNYPRPVF